VSRSLSFGVVATVTSLAVLAPWPRVLSGTEPVGLYADARDVVARQDSDVYDGVWHFWWTARAVSEKVDPMFCPLIFHPSGASLSLHNIGWTSTLLHAVSGFPSNPVRALNISLFLGTLMTFAAAALLARQWGAGGEGAMLSGMIMALTPSRIAHLYQHYNIAQTGWVLLALFFITRYLRKGRGGAMIAVFTALATLESLYHSLLVALGFIAVLVLLRTEISGKRMLKAGILMACAMIAAGCWFIPRHGATPTDNYTWREAVHWSAEPVSYLLPSSFGLGAAAFGFPLKYPWMPNTFEGQVSSGITVLLVFSAFCVKRRKLSLAVVSLGILLLSFGPLLKWNGSPTPLPLPWMLPARVPLLAQARVPARLALLFGGLTAVTAGVVFHHLKGAVRWVLLALIVFELTIPRLPTVSASFPGGILHARGPVLDIPAGSMTRITAFYQTHHRHPRLTAFLARGGEEALSSAGLSNLLMGDSSMVTDGTLRETAAETVLYHRMLLSRRERLFYDSLYAPAFPEASPEESVWVWHR